MGALSELKGACGKLTKPWILIRPLQRLEALTFLAMEGTHTTAIIEAAKANGGEHYFVEQDRAADPKAQLGASSRYLAGLGFV
jgi:hypothetical protein